MLHLTALGLSLLAAPALAQPPAAPAATPPVDYVAVRFETTINRPAPLVWSKAGGDFCALFVLRRADCTIVSGDGEVPTIRRLGATTFEHMIAKTPMSYTYGQLVGGMQAYDYHVTLAAAPISATSSKLTYLFVYDQAKVTADQRQATKAALQRFRGVLDTVKAAIEAAP
jgi:hypothetical protein